MHTKLLVNTGSNMNMADCVEMTQPSSAGFILRWYFVCSQVEDKLPHLKAIIQYKDALKEKRPNLYTVSSQAVYDKQDKNSVA